MKSSELHLFIIWEKGRTPENEILKDIEKNFDILKRYEVTWSKAKFPENLTRFYGLNLPKGSSKEKHVGTGPFLLIIVKDKAPVYDTHTTSKGDFYINSKMFLAKTRHREWMGGGHRVHATNTPEEFEHDLMMLLGKNPKDFLESLKNSKLETHKKDIMGSNGWKDLPELFYSLNSTLNYVVLRNYEVLPNSFYSNEHGDIDLLVDNYELAIYALNAKPVCEEDYRVYNTVLISGEEVYFDFRHVGDQYYDKRWQKHILANKVLNNKNIYVPSKEDHDYSLLYHALIHKREIADDYKQRLAKLNPSGAGFDKTVMCKLLGWFLAKRDYAPTTPIDESVYANPDNLKAIKSAMFLSKPHRYGGRRIKRLAKTPIKRIIK